MKKQKILAFLLIGSLLLSLSAVAFAADEVTLGDGADASVSSMGEKEITIPSKVNIPLTSLTITPPAGIIVNPFKMKVNVTKDDTTEDSVISTPGLIINNSDIKMKITAKPLITPQNGSNLQIVESESSLTDITDKPAVFMDLAMSIMDAGTATEAKTYKSDYKGKDNIASGTTKFALTKHAPFTDKDKTSTDIKTCSLTLYSKKEIDDGNLTLAKDNASQFGVYLITGKSNKGDLWKENVDAPTVKIAFDIQPDLAADATP